MIIADNKDLIIEKMVLGPYETNAYILVSKNTSESAVIDAPSEVDKIIERLQGTTLKYIFLTHDHYDHTDGMTVLREKLKVPLAAHSLSSRQLTTPPEILLRGGEIINLGKLRIETLFTPGHTAGSLCFKTGKYLFAGDTLFPGGPGHTDTRDDFKQILDSIISKIYNFPDNTIILPGHGGSTSIKDSKEEFVMYARNPHAGAFGDVTWLA